MFDFPRLQALHAGQSLFVSIKGTNRRMLLWLSSWLCASWCSDAATTATLRGQWWRTARVFERGPHLVAVLGLWTLVVSLLCALSGLLLFAFALAMQDNSAWPNAHVWAPAALVPAMLAVFVVVCLLAEAGAVAAWRRWGVRNGLRAMPITMDDVHSLTARAVDGNDEDDNSAL